MDSLLMRDAFFFLCLPLKADGQLALRNKLTRSCHLAQTTNSAAKISGHDIMNAINNN